METNSCNQLFIYSSLRKGFHEKAFNYLSHYFTFVSAAKVKGELRISNGIPVALPSIENLFIEGELYKLNKEDDFSYVFGQLDDYEGLITTAEEKPLYRREIVTVFKPGGGDTNAWIYWYAGDLTAEPQIESFDAFTSGK